MISLQKLRRLSCICAYCGKVMPMNERTNDHLIPRCAGGTTKTHNIVICCPNCNTLKGPMEVNEFLENNSDKAEHFYNYLNMIDYQTGNNEYSTAIIYNLSESLKNTYLKKQSEKKAKKLRDKKNKENRETLRTKFNEAQNIEYHFELSGQKFYINELQAKILDYYLEHPNFSDYKTLAENLGIKKTRFIREICCINNLTGIFKIKKISENGIVLNDFTCNNIQNKIIKTSDNPNHQSFLPGIDENGNLRVIMADTNDYNLDENIELIKAGAEAMQEG